VDFSLAELHDVIAEVAGDREAIVGTRRLTYTEVAERTRRLANFLQSRGLQVRAERSDLAPHESGQEHLAIYLYNGH
jgi:fatty-acyl-CoA synthase